MPLTDKVLVLDLDSTLIYTSEDFKQYTKLELYTNPNNINLRSRIYKFDVIDVVEKPGSGVRSSMWGIFRPHVYEFLDFAFYYFDKVIVWSAGQLRYVHAICDVLFTNPKQQPCLIYSHDDCVKGDNYLYKPLVKICQKEIKDLDLSKLYILDDNEITFSKNKDNALHIPPYEPKFNPEGINASEDILYNLSKWLMKPDILNANDARKTDKRDCFTYTKNHPILNTFFKN